MRNCYPTRSGVLGPSHPDTLATRHSIAFWTGQCGDPAGALRLFEELLLDRVRVQGSSHSDTLATRHSIAFWTGQCGDPAGALRLFEELLPDQTRVLCPTHPDTLATRNDIGACTEELQTTKPRPGAGSETGNPSNPDSGPA